MGTAGMQEEGVLGLTTLTAALTPHDAQHPPPHISESTNPNCDANPTTRANPCLAAENQ